LAGQFQETLMALRFFALAGLTVVTAMATASSVATFRHTHLHRMTDSGLAHLRAFGSRGAQQPGDSGVSKFDGALADLSRHAALVRADHAMEDLRSLNPAAKFQQAAGGPPLVLIDAVTRGDPAELKAALVELGLQHASLYANDVGGWLPVAQLNAATARAEVHGIRAAMSRTRSGAVTSQGDFAQHSDVTRSANSLSGAGVTVGIISDSYNCYAVFAANAVPASGDSGYASNGFLATAATDISSGDLPAASSVNVLEEAPCMTNGHYTGYPTQLPFSDEGRAMMQIVHDVAPGAKLAFYTAENSEADFARGIGQLAAAGAKIIADDVGYFDEPIFQDGLVSQAVDAVQAQGVAYFSAAGNDGTLAYDNLAPSFSAISPSGPNAGEQLLNFNTGVGAPATSLPVTIAPLIPGEPVAIVVEWDQPYVTGSRGSGGATSSIDVCITGASGIDDITDVDGHPATCSGPNSVGQDPYQVLIIANPANSGGNSAAVNLNIQVGLVTGTRVPGRIKVLVEDDGAGSTINAPFQSVGATIQGHPSAVGAAAVGAAFYLATPACGDNPAELEPFSSAGGDPILFDTTGVRLMTAEFRQKPDFVGPNGGNNTFLGFTLTSAETMTNITACQDNLKYPNFFGTSAATPHVAGIAALMLEANPAVTPTQIYQALRDGALPMGTGTVPNFDSGFGFVQADASFALMTPVSPAAPTLSLAANSIVAGSSTTLTWSSVNVTGCTASGNWSGALAANGSQTVKPAAVGTGSYVLTCANAAGMSPASTATLTVTAAPKSGGGGALDGLTAVALAGLGLAGIFRFRWRVLR
jgi:Subtilase family